jgi:hypothetical protein
LRAPQARKEVDQPESIRINQNNKRKQQMMLAYHSDPSLKARVLAELAKHETADRLRQSYGYWRDDANGIYHGCGVGCSLESLRVVMGLETIDHKDHALYESLIGVPRVLAMFEDRFFERLPFVTARQFPRRFLEAIQPGADLSMVFPQLMRAILAEPSGVQTLVAQRPTIKPSVDSVIALYDRWLAGDQPSVEDWHKAREAAYDAAAYATTTTYLIDAADAAAYAAARAADAATRTGNYAYAAIYAADAAAYAYAAADAATDAAIYADAVAYADNGATASAAEIQRQADLLIRCLGEAPVK